jgi:hypothetical protein
LAEDRRTPDQGSAARERELDTRVEELTREIADLVNTAGVESRQHLREYAIDLLKEETERDDAAPTTAGEREASTNFSPLAFAILIGVVALPLVLLFAPLGLGLLAVAIVMGIWGLIDIFVRR